MPVLNYYNVWIFLSDPAPCIYPVEGINGIQNSGDLYSFRGSVVGELCFPGEEKTGILQREGKYFHIMSFGGELPGKALII